MATVHHKRSSRYVTGTLGTQVRHATLTFDQQQADVVLHYWGLLKADPNAAARGLNRSAGGCRKLASEWVGLLSELDADGYWVQSRCDHATRLMGNRPEDPSDETAFWFRYYNVAAVEPRDEAVEAWLAAAGDSPSLPDTLGWIRGGTPPTPEQARAWLREAATTELAAVRKHAETLRINFEDPDRAAAEEQAMILAPAEMALWLRYEKMHDSMFHRAYNALERPEAAQPDADPTDDPDGHGEGPSDPSSESEYAMRLAAASACPGHRPGRRGSGSDG